MSTSRKVIIVGSGPAGYTAAIYAARANLAPLGFTGFQAGGQLMLTTAVENYPGFPDGIMGPDLMEGMRKQAERVGAELVSEDVTALDLRRRPFVVTAGETPHAAEALILATGATARMLGLPSEAQLLGRGVSTCATCDGFFFRDQDVMVVGGGDSAMEEALYLARMARSVTVVHRRETLRASKIMQDRARSHPRIRFILNRVVDEVLGTGEGRVTGARLREPATGAVSDHAVQGVFVAIGHDPNTALVRGQLELHPNGYVKVEPGSTRTSVPGVFAAGDVADFTWRQAITAAATGCMAALESERFLEAHAA